MSDNVKVTVTITPEVKAVIEKRAAKREIGFSEALENLIEVAVSRLNATNRYYKKVKAEKGEKAPKKKAAKKAAGKPSVAKARAPRKPKVAEPMNAAPAGESAASPI